MARSTANSLVVDQAGLFQYSGVLDQLRDTARYLSRHADHDPVTISMMVDQFETLRTQLRAVVREDAAARADELIPDLPRDTATFAAVYFAAAALARWIDTVHQTPQFLLSQEVAVANALKVTEKVEEVLAGASDPIPALTGAPAHGLGQYL